MDSFTLVPPPWYERILLFQEIAKKIGADYHTIIAFHECPKTLFAEVGYQGIESSIKSDQIHEFMMFEPLDSLRDIVVILQLPPGTL